MSPYVGQPIKRFEDERLLRGEGRFVGDISLPGMLHMVVGRSVHAHARILGIDVSAAKAAPGVVDVITGADLAMLHDISVLRRPGVFSKAGAEHPLLARDRVLYVGQPVYLVVAESLAAAEDAVGLVQVDYEPLDVLVDAEAAARGDGPILHPSLEDNIALQTSVVAGDADGAFARADVVVGGSFTVPRVSPAPLECRGAVASYDPERNEVTLWTSTQSPHETREHMRHVLGEGPPDFRVIAPDVGGGFGQKHHLYPDEAAVGYLAWKMRRPVKWVEQRQENLVASHSRGVTGRIEAAVRRDGRILGVRARLIADLGAYQIHGSLLAADITCKRLTGPYDIQDVDIELLGVVTNKPPVGPYRGAGQPEASFFMERLVDLIARQLGLDPVEVRERNLIQPEQFPYTTAAGIPYDTGNYPRALRHALDVADYDALRREQRTRGGDGPRLLGIGISTITNGSGGSGGATARSSYARVTVQPDGHVILDSDVSPHGQGMATSFPQIAADQLGVPPSHITLRTGDTAYSRPAGPGSGTYASRSLVIGGSAVYLAAREARELLMATAAHAFECSPDDVELSEGRAWDRRQPSRSMGIGELAVLAQRGRAPTASGCLEVEHVWTLPSSAFSFATHVVAVEVDKATGVVNIRKYVAVHDIGPAVNPMIVEAQIRGGIAQGLGEALQEVVEYAEDGRTTAVSLMDYAMPLAEDIPEVTVSLLDTPSTFTPMGIRGVGEAPSTASPAALANAVMDALAPLGVWHIDMPLTPEKVWRAIRDAAPRTD